MSQPARRFPRGYRVDQAQGGRFYVWNNEKYWSVTTIIGGGLPKPALLPWGIKMVAEGATKLAEKMPTLLEELGEDGLIRHLKGLPYASRDKAGNLGSRVHEAAEAYALERPYPEWSEDERPYLEGFVSWLDDFRPSFIAVEAPVFSKTERYAGTLDAIVELDHPGLGLGLMFGVEEDRPLKILVDYKTGKGVYPEVGLQLAAYRYAETFLGLPDASESPMPKLDGAAVLHLKKSGGYSFLPVKADESLFRAFLYCREVFRFQEELSRSVVGSELKPPPRPVAATVVPKGVGEP